MEKTVESHVYFAGYKFLDSASLNSNETIVADTLAAGDKVALFLTLQDLQGEGIKAKHKEVFEHQIDLLIVDETHFGARGASYGKVLQQYNLSKSQIEKELQNIDGFETLEQVDEAVKALDTKIRIHLSGTPYRILMSDEFKKKTSLPLFSLRTLSTLRSSGTTNISKRMTATNGTILIMDFHR